MQFGKGMSVLMLLWLLVLSYQHSKAFQIREKVLTKTIRRLLRSFLALIALYSDFLFSIILISSFILHAIRCTKTSSLSLLSSELSLNIEEVFSCSITVLDIPRDVKTKFVIHMSSPLCGKSRVAFFSPSFFWYSSCNSSHVQNLSSKFLMDLATCFITHSSESLTGS